jgi:NAD(P)-dependent dehydrogenase (short-subunit alcohol dehydrogenase family)
MSMATFDFSGRRVVVTDGTRGLGLGIARAFANSGAQVVATGPRSRATTSDEDLCGIEHHRLELTDAEALADFAAQIGPVDVLVNAAGLRLPHAAQEHPESVREAVADGQVGPVQLTRQLRPWLESSALRGGGAVIHTHALREWFAFSRGATSAHADLISHTARQGVSWGQSGVRVNAVSTSLAVTRPVVPELSGIADPAEAESTDDVASAVLFLASEAAACIAGQTVIVREQVARVS